MGVTVFSSLHEERIEDLGTWLETGNAVTLDEIVDVKEFIPRMLETADQKKDLQAVSG